MIIFLLYISAGIAKVTHLIVLYWRKVPEMLSQMRLDEHILMWDIFREAPEENTESQSFITEKKWKVFHHFRKQPKFLLYP